MIRTLKAGEVVPSAPPRRYVAAHGYVRLRWTVGPGPGDQVEVYEHRVVDGRVTTAEHVHHRNHKRDDNRPENLAHLTAEQHAAEHADSKRDAEIVSLYQQGWSTVRLGSRFNLNPSSVRKALLRSGVALRSPSDYVQPVELERVKQLHGEGVRAQRMASMLGVGVERINRALDELGLPRFAPGRPPTRPDGTYQATEAP